VNTIRNSIFLAAGLTVILVEQKLGFARKVGHEFRLMKKAEWLPAIRWTSSVMI
jgi:ABC-type branched-subunit amino acid transport system ATPase component